MKHTNLLVDVAPCTTPANHGICRGRAVDLWLTVNGQDSFAVEFHQVLFDEASFQSKWIIIPWKCLHLLGSKARLTLSLPSSPKKYILPTFQRELYSIHEVVELCEM